MTDHTQRHVVVGYDGSGGSRRALEWAARYAKETGAALELVSAWRRPVAYAGSVIGSPDPEQRARRILDEAAVSVSPPVDRLTTVVVRGAAGDVLVERSKTAELLVVGSRGLDAARYTVLGSVSAHACTTRTARCS
jgi:nucleotide-binding universal stress UspA family protein